MVHAVRQRNREPGRGCCKSTGCGIPFFRFRGNDERKVRFAPESRKGWKSLKKGDRVSGVIEKMEFPNKGIMTADGEKLVVNRSTVSRTIKRGEARLQRCLRYGAEAYLRSMEP